MTARELFAILRDSSKRGTLLFKFVIAAWGEPPVFGYDKTRRPSRIVIQGEAAINGSARSRCRTRDHLGYGNFEIRISRNGILITRLTDLTPSAQRVRVYSILLRIQNEDWNIQVYGKEISSLREKTAGCRGELGCDGVELSFKLDSGGRPAFSMTI